MKRVLFFLLLIALGISAIAQQSIQLRSTDRAECVKADYNSLKANFSFSSLDANAVETTRGAFSEIHIDGAFPNGNVGEPQLPMVTRLIAIPTGATPVVTLGAHSETEFTLSDYDIDRVSPMQAPVRKNVDPSTVEYAFNEAAYARNSYNDEPIAMVEVLGTMRGITLGRLIVRPVRYNPVAGTVKMFNDIEVSVDFQNGDAESTARMFKTTSSPAFNSFYNQIFNIDMLTGGTRDAYTDHPDLYNTPVKMLVICYSGFKNNEALNSWLQWKLQKGYYVDIHYTDETGTTSSAIASFIKTKYNASVVAGNAYTYLIVIGDTGQVPYYTRDYEDSTAGYVASDLGYASVDFPTNSDDVFPDMYYSRMSAENTTHLTNYINKVLTYEKFEFTDGGNYLNNVILVGGWDDDWTSLVARPTINYATTYYFNSNNTTYGGFSGGTIKATVSTSSTQGYSGTNNGCYQGINNGACFVNYTAHGNKQEWSQPLFTAAQVATLTNTGKYFFAVGNCCLSGNFNSTTTTYSPGSDIGTNACFGETMIRVPNAGAIAYIGCTDYTIWMEDYYWAVGSGIHFGSNYSLQGTATTSNTTTGVYDAMFRDDYWNSASSLLFVGNIAVTAAENNSTGYDTDAGYKYYFKYYHTFGDGSVMPYVTKPETNTVTIPSTVTPGTNSITVNALAGSYVAVTDNNSVIYGVGVANSSGEATVNITNAIPNDGTLYVVVTRQQYQPYFGTISVAGGAQYEITATVNPENAGTVTGVGTYYETNQCTLTATPNHGYAFDNWKLGNNVVSTEPSYTYTVTGEANYTANFHALTLHQITYAPQQANGTINVSPSTAYVGDIITLTATPSAGYCLYQWHVTTGRAEIPVVNNQFEMPDADVTITAEFREGYTVTLASVMNGTISATPTTALDGTNITLTATPATGYDLDYWDVFKTGDPNTTVTVNDNSFTMPAYNVTVSAVFTTPSEEDVTIGSGTNTNNYLPTYAYYNYCLTQQIYTSAEVGPACTITKVAFKVANSKSTSRTIDIYMSHTSKSSFSATGSWNVSSSDWVAQGTSYRVFSGSVDFNASDWTTITLDTPFEYDGSSNLLLTVDDNTGSDVYSSDSPSFYVNSNSNYTAIYKYNDDTNYNPASMSTSGTPLKANSYVVFTKAVPSTEGILSVSPTSLTGFETSAGTPSTAQSISVIGSNLQADLVVSAPNGYEVCASQNGTYNGTLTLTPSSGSLRTNVFVRLKSDVDPGAYSGNLTLTSGTTTATVSLSGEVINPNYWTPVQVGPNTMTVIAQVQIDGVPVTDCENYELGAFCGAECRGDVIGLDDEDVFFISLYGNENDENTFMLYDIAEGEVHQGVCYYTVIYQDNAVMGTYAQPIVLNFVTTSAFTKDIIGYSANAKDRYYLIASPIGTVSPTNVTNMLANDYDLYYFEQNPGDDLEWRNYEASAFNLTLGKGYLYANIQNVTLTFSGTPYYGNGEVTLSKADNVRFSGWNLVGNPFAQTAYITKPFYTMNGTGTEIIPGSGNSVEAMEGIFVIADNDGETMTFSTGILAKAEGQIVLNVNQGEATLDRAIVRMGEGDVLPKFMLNANNTKVYITQEGHEYAVVRATDAGVIPVSFKAAHNGEYSICVNVDDTEVNYLHLIDNMTGADIDVLQTPTYTFDATKDDYTSRFKLVFATGDAEEDNFAFFTNDNWIISNDGEAVLQVIDINGRVLSSEEIHGSLSKHISAVPGIYMLRLIKGDDVRVQKIVVR